MAMYERAVKDSLETTFGRPVQALFRIVTGILIFECNPFVFHSFFLAFTLLFFAIQNRRRRRRKLQRTPERKSSRASGRIDFVRQRNDLRTSSWDEGQLESRRSSFSSRVTSGLQQAAVIPPLAAILRISLPVQVEEVPESVPPLRNRGRGTDHVKASCRANY